MVCARAWFFRLGIGRAGEMAAGFKVCPWAAAQVGVVLE